MSREWKYVQLDRWVRAHTWITWETPACHRQAQKSPLCSRRWVERRRAAPELSTGGHQGQWPGPATQAGVSRAPTSRWRAGLSPGGSKCL